MNLTYPRLTVCPRDVDFRESSTCTRSLRTRIHTCIITVHRWMRLRTRPFRSEQQSVWADVPSPYHPVERQEYRHQRWHRHHIP